MEQELKNNSKKRVIPIVVLVAIIALAVGIGVTLSSASPAKRLQQQLDLGARYLSELDYEQAIAAYEAALEIDQKSAAAYEGLARAYGETEEYASVADVYMRASESLDASELAALSDAITEMTLADLEALVQAGQYDEALRIIGILSEVIKDDRLDDVAVRVQERILAEHVLVWERALYQTIMEGGYLNAGGDAVFGTEEMTEPVSFALKDLDVMRDGIPEVSVYNGSHVYLSSVNYLYRFVDERYRYIGGLKGCNYDSHRFSDNPNYPGIFDEGAHTGGYWTFYVYIDKNGTLQSEEVVSGDAREEGLKELSRTNDDALYKAYKQIDGRQWTDGNGQQYELKYYSAEEIRAMGWEAFLEEYGYKSFLFSEYATERVQTGKDEIAAEIDAHKQIQTVSVGALPKKLVEFLSDFGWYSDNEGYDCESPKNMYDFYAFYFGNEYLCLENVYPGLVNVVHDTYTDRIMDANSADWVLKNIYNWEDDLIASLKNDGVSEWFYYADGKYYGRGAGVGGGYLADIKTAWFDGEHYYIEYELYTDGFNAGWVSVGTHYAEMEYKTFDGKSYWSIYKDSLQPFGMFAVQETNTSASTNGTDEYTSVEELVLNKDLQRDLNVFLCNFTEANLGYGLGVDFYQYDHESVDISQLMNLSMVWTMENQYQNLTHYPDDELTHLGINLQQINFVIDRYFGFTITDVQAKQYSNNEREYYRDGVFHWRYFEGVAPPYETAVVDRASRLSDGNVMLEFTVYTIEQRVNGVDYSLTPSQASRQYAQESTWPKEEPYHGTAIASPYEHNGKTRYHLLKYETDH